MSNEDNEPDEKRTRGGVRKVVKVAVVVLAIMALLVAGRVFNLQEHLHGLLDRIQALGAVGYVVFFAVYVLACVLLIPGSVLTLGAGAIYGVLVGSILISLSSTIGATAAFLVGRYLARDKVAKKIAGNRKFAAIDDAVGREGWKIVGLTRLSPAFPFTLLNYAYGLTKVKLRDYFFASWIGMLPGTILYVYLGSLAQSLTAVGTGCEDCERSPMEWAMYAVGLLATVGVTWYVTRIARRALNQRIEKGDVL